MADESNYSCPALTIRFIHKPKNVAQAADWPGARHAKRRRALCSQWEASSTYSPSLLLPCCLFNPLPFFTLFHSLPRCIAAVKTTARLKRMQRLNKCCVLERRDSWTRLSSYTFRVDCTCSESLLNPLWGWVLSSDLLLCRLLSPAICVFCSVVLKPSHCSSFACRWQGEAL